MQKLITYLPGADLARWLKPLGQALALAFGLLSEPRENKDFWKEYRKACVWMGLHSFHFIALAAIFVASALDVQVVIEMYKYKAEDFAGALIAIGLLREIGPLVVGLAWCAAIAAHVSEEAAFRNRNNANTDYAADFILPRLLAACSMAIPLSAYGLVLGFISGAMLSPLIGGPQPMTFIHFGLQAVHAKDLFTYFIKLVLINPTIAVFAGSVSGRWQTQSESPAANAVFATFICGFIANLAVTVFLYLGRG